MVREDLSCSCSEGQVHNTHERPLRYIRGDYSGLCVDSCKYRFPEILEFLESEHSIFVSNMYHQKEFWSSVIPINSVSDVYILFENFAPGINHVAFRFDFLKKKPILSQEIRSHSQLKNKKEHAAGAIVISPEAAPPQDIKYGMWDGFVGNYALMNRLMTYDQYLSLVQEVRHPFRTFRLKLSPKEAQQLLLLLLMDAKTVFNNQYQLVFNNCATTAIDSTLQAKGLLASKQWHIWGVLDPLRGLPISQPMGTLRTLKWWDLIDQHSFYTSEIENN